MPCRCVWRFVVVLVVAFLVIGLWGNLRNYWDTLKHTFSGSHVGEQSVSGDTEYFCPMDPGVISDWPAICPVCNMDLVRRKRGEATLLPEGVVARMQLSPYRIQLAGIKTAVVARRPLAREIILAGRVIESTIAGTENASDPTSAHRDVSLVLVCEAHAVDQPLLTTDRRAEISVDGLPGSKPLGGRIGAARAASGKGAGRHLLTVEIELENPDRALRPGTFCGSSAHRRASFRY